MLGVSFDLFAEVLDEDAEIIDLIAVVGPPNSLQQLAMGQSLIGALRQITQEIQFLGGKVYTLAFAQNGRPVADIIASPAEALNVFDFEEPAHRKVNPGHWAYMASGVDDDATLRANRDGFKHIELRPRRLRDATAGAYVVVEKILEEDEELPRSWPVAGTTGYPGDARFSRDASIGVRHMHGRAFMPDVQQIELTVDRGIEQRHDVVAGQREDGRVTGSFQCLDYDVGAAPGNCHFTKFQRPGAEG